jgi:hypothetical protein
MDSFITAGLLEYTQQDYLVTLLFVLELEIQLIQHLSKHLLEAYVRLILPPDERPIP